MDKVNYLKNIKNSGVLLSAIFAFMFFSVIKSWGQTTVTVGGGATVTCPATPTATWATPPTGVTFSNWSRGSGVTCATASTALSGSGFNVTSAAAGFTANKYYSVTITADAVTNFTLSSITWLTAVSSGTCNFDIRYSNNGGTVTSFGTTGTSTTSNTFNGSVSVSPGTSIVIYLIPWGTGAAGTTVRFGNGSTFTLTATNSAPVTSFGPGDIAIVGLCTYIDTCIATSGTGIDEISFVSFEDITPGTTIDITDNGYERKTCGSNTWGNTEGIIRITRNTSTILKGTIVTIRIYQESVFTPVQPDGNWTATYPNTGFGNFDMNSKDEQIYIMQGGTWSKGTSSGSHDATYTGGTLMFGINTYTAWTCNGLSTQRGDLPLALKCFSILPGIAAKNIKYTGIVTPASQKDWVDRLNSSANWTGSNSCSAYVSSGLDYAGSTQYYSIITGGFNAGQWTGATNNDWYDCNNWQNFKVPDSLANVVIDNVTNDPVIGASPVLYPNGAVCNDLSITSTSGSGILTLNNSLSYLSIKGNIINNGIITATNGLTDLRSANAQSFSGTGTTGFYNLRLNNTNSAGVSLSQDVSVGNLLTFTNGMLSTGTNKLIITNPVVPTISGYTSSKFINGNLRHYIGSNASTYTFPIGNGITSANYKRIDLVNNNLAGVNYIDASVSAITESAPNNDATFAAAGQSQNNSALWYIMENAQWDLSPDAAPTGNSYGVRLYTANTGLSATDDNSFCPVKRPSASTTYADWVSLRSTTTIPASGAAGRIYNSGAGYAERLGYTSFSKHAIAKSTGPLPIELLTFTAVYNGISAVDLKWATATETNNDYFTIERSIDAAKFMPILRVKGAGNSSELLNYYDADKNPNKGINYYRLKQTDFNGRASYSQIVSVNVESAFSASIYPNPATSELNIKISTSLNEQARIEIVSLQGISLNKTTVQAEEDGLFSVDLQPYAAGAYILRMTIGSETKQTLFIKQ